MAIINIIALVILVLYTAFLLFGATGFINTPVFNVVFQKENHTKVCIIICARNEEKNINLCLRSIIEQNFDKHLLEIIVVNDHSSDDTYSVIKNTLQNSTCHYQIINNTSQQGKKKSITSAIEICNSELIITRDADTFTHNANWLKTIISFYESNKKEFIIAPLLIENKPELLSQLQVSENLALQIITGGYAFHKKSFLCNGANLAFTKNIFKKVNGYNSHKDIPSGDDVLFLEEVKKIAPETIAYLKHKDALVFTFPALNIPKFLTQRTRWASKFKINPNPINFLMGFSVFLTHFFTLFYLSKLIFIPHLGLFGLFFVLSRLFIDFLLLFLASRFYGNAPNWWLFLPLNVVYSLIVPIITTLTLFYKPKWK